MKVSVIGAGNVGAKAVYYIAEKNIADIVMVDVVNGLASSKALDFLHAAPLRGYEVRIRGTTDFAEIEGSDVVVITAGIARKPGMDRMDLLKTNVGIAAPGRAGNRPSSAQRCRHRRDEPAGRHFHGRPARDGVCPAEGRGDGRRAGFHAVPLVHRREAGRLARRRAGHGPRRPRGRDGPPHPLHLGGRHPAGPAPGRPEHRGPGEAHAHRRSGDRRAS